MLSGGPLNGQLVKVAARQPVRVALPSALRFPGEQHEAMPVLDVLVYEPTGKTIPNSVVELYGFSE